MITTEGFSNKGYSLVELLITIAIFAIVSAGIATVFLTGQQEYGVRDATIRMQQQARLAVSDMEQEVKKAGYGFADIGTLKFNVYSSGSPSNPIIRAVVKASSNNAPGVADNITFFYQNSAADTDTDVSIKAAYTSSSDDTPVSSLKDSLQNDLFKSNDLYLVYEVYDPSKTPKNASLLQVSGTGTNSSGIDTIAHSARSQWPYNPPSTFSLFPVGGYGIGSKVLNLRSADVKRVTYFVDGDRNLVKVVRTESSGAEQRHVVAAGIEDLQIQYQFKNDGTWYDYAEFDSSVAGDPAHVNPPNDASHSLGNLRAVKVSISVRTAKPDRHYGGDGYRRMKISTTIALRNFAMRGRPS